MTVAALFFGNVFGTAAERALGVFVALRWVTSFPVSDSPIALTLMIQFARSEC